MEFEVNEDIAGKEYWDNVWGQSQIPKIIDPHNKSVKNVGYLAWNELCHKIFELCIESTDGKLLIEVGCGNSAFLPYMGKEFGFKVSGLDYSEIGCEMARKTAAYYGVETDIFHVDLFGLTEDLRGKYDVVFAAGVIEHFADTCKPVKAMADLARGGGGIVINIIPNFSPGSTMGKVQKKYASDIYDKHVPLTRENLIDAHQKAGLKMLYCEYVMASNYGVVNFGERHNLARVYCAVGMIKMFLKRDRLISTNKNASYIVYVGQKSNDTDLF